MIRVLVVDDHDLFREMVSAALRLQDDIEVVGACADGREAVQVFCDVRPDVVLMDLSMPVLGGADATRELVAIDPAARVLLLTSSPHGIEMERAVAAGALGCVRKGAGHQELVRAITAAGRSGMGGDPGAPLIRPNSWPQRPSPRAGQWRRR